MQHRADLTFPLDDEGAARAVAGALALELGDGPEGSRAALRREGATLLVTVEAADLSGLRAALNSLLRLLDAAQRVASASH